MIKYSSKDDCIMNGSGLIKYLDDFELSSKNIATLMIIISDNVATNKMIEYLGFDNINKTIKDLGFNHTILKAKKLDFDIYNIYLIKKLFFFFFLFLLLLIILLLFSISSSLKMDKFF